jgi:hypothetical protein
MKSLNKELWRFIATIVAIALFLTLALTGTVAATTYHVNVATGNDGNDGSAGAPWKTITHAVDTVPAGASAADPNIIQVAAGLYEPPNETFPITFNNGSISLIGAGAAITTIDGEGAGTILYINATGITIEGFTITNGTDGIFSNDSSGFTIVDNNFTDVSDGVRLEINKENLTTAYTVDPISIHGNAFSISVDGVYLYINLDYDAAVTGNTVTIGDIDILDNVFDMTATDGVEIEEIYVQELNGGSIAVGEVNISGNEFYGGTYGIAFYGDFYNLTNTTVTAGDVVVNNNTFENQTDTAMDIDYYDADYWYGTTTGTYGDLEINGNNITSVTTKAIYIDDYADFEYFEDDAALTVGNLYIEGNEINVSGGGVYLYYTYAYDLDDNASVAMGEVFINGNTIISRSDNGIYLEYSGFGEDMCGNSEVMTGAVHIDENRINAGSDAIYVYYDGVAYEMEENATLSMGDMYVRDNNISSDYDGIYLEYEEEVGYDMNGNASAELPDYVITGNTFTVSGDGIELDTYEIPNEVYDDAIFDFGGFFIDDNTFSCEYGIDFVYDDFCYDNYGRSASIIGDVTITNNRFHDVSNDAIYIYYDDIGYDLYENSTLDVGDLLIADNVIENVTGGDGIDVLYFWIDSYDESRVTMGMLDILRNEIGNVSEDGIDIDYYLNPDGNSTQTIGRALIQGNTIDACGWAGVYLFMLLDNESGATVNLGNPLIEGNTISNCGDGVDFEFVENATIRRNMIVNNTGLPFSGVDLDSDSANNQIYENCFINNTPDQAVDNGENNIFDRNFWNDWNGSGPYEIAGTAENADENPRDECPLGQEPSAPAKLPALTPAGLITLVGVLSAIAALSMKIRKRR